MVSFTAWYPWKQREDIPGSQYGGVYLIARFESGNVRQGPAEPLNLQVILIGQTGGRTKTGDPSPDAYFTKRWRDFEISASSGEKGHIGGRHYYALGLPPPPDDLWVSASQFPLPNSEEIQPFRFSVGEIETKVIRRFIAVRYVDQINELEHDLIVQFKNKHGRLPICNREIPRVLGKRVE